MGDDSTRMAPVTPPFVRRMRRAAGAAKRWLAPSEEVVAWRRACRLSETTPRFTSGTITLGPYSLRYPDLLTLCPQWHDIFVAQSLAFETTEAAPRILDCGANIGLAALFYKARYPAARITSFEADPSIAAVLASNLQANGAADVEVVAAAVWTDDGETTFRVDGSDAGAIAPSVAAGTPEFITVPTVRLADRLARERVTLLKLDIEGAESAVLHSCADVLHNVDALLLEVHEFDPRQRRCPELLQLLERSGYMYAVSHVTPLPWRRVRDLAPGPFPRQSGLWVEAISAWRPDR
jgi:FkbM family methyltransferase